MIKTRVYDNYDVIVVGGGPGGLAAATAAARQGARTILFEREGHLGGAATTMMVQPFMRHRTRHDNREPGETVNAGLFAEIPMRWRSKKRSTSTRCSMTLTSSASSARWTRSSSRRA